MGERETDLVAEIYSLKAQVCSLEKSLQEIKEELRTTRQMLNGYLENRIKMVTKSMLGEILLTVLTSSAVISALMTLVMRLWK